MQNRQKLSVEGNVLPHTELDWGGGGRDNSGIHNCYRVSNLEVKQCLKNTKQKKQKNNVHDITKKVNSWESTE